MTTLDDGFITAGCRPAVPESEPRVRIHSAPATQSVLFNYILQMAEISVPREPSINRSPARHRFRSLLTTRRIGSVGRPADRPDRARAVQGSGGPCGGRGLKSILLRQADPIINDFPAKWTKWSRLSAPSHVPSVNNPFRFLLKLRLSSLAIAAAVAFALRHPRTNGTVGARLPASLQNSYSDGWFEPTDFVRISSSRRFMAIRTSIAKQTVTRR